MLPFHSRSNELVTASQFTNKSFRQWLRAKFQTLKFRVHRMRSIHKYAVRFSRMSDAELQTVVNRERTCRGWTSERSYFLYALRRECAKRN